MTSHLVIVARGNAVEKNGTIYFQKQDSLLLSGLRSNWHRVTCLIPVFERCNPMYKVFSIYDAQITYDAFHIEV